MGGGCAAKLTVGSGIGGVISKCKSDVYCERSESYAHVE